MMEIDARIAMLIGDCKEDVKRISRGFQAWIRFRLQQSLLR
jgi:hypothetical protein